jgi:NTE family protein
MAKALVLGGGGVAGIAWETGVLLGLAEAGVDLTDADLLVGTSAGSVVATQVATGLALADLHALQLASHTHERTVEFDVEAMIARFVELLADRPHPEELRRRIGEWALQADTVPEADRLSIVDARLPVKEWPGRGLRITAVDAATGEFVVFDRASGVGLVDAVAASCAVPGVWPPVTIGDRRYIDGGVRSTINADLAEGHDRVVVLTPFTAGLAGDVAHECDALRDAGAQVAVVVADERSVAAFGTNPLDPSTRAPSAEAGRAQAAVVVDAVAEVWR